MIDLLRHIQKFIHPKWQNYYLDYPVDLKSQYDKYIDRNYNRIIQNIFKKNDHDYQKSLMSFIQYKDQLLEIPLTLKDSGSLDSAWINGFFPGLDIVSLYSLLAIFHPTHFLEIGSGHSTKIAYKSIIDNSLQTQLISIDPEPRADISGVVDVQIKRNVESMSVDDPIFMGLLPGDILFIDSSHRVLPNSDCSFIYNELIPSLPSGVIIHIHDIYLPYDYPQFMCDRFYNENQILAAYFLSNPSYFEVILPNFYVFKNEDVWKYVSPLFDIPKMSKVEKHGGSIWLRKN